MLDALIVTTGCPWTSKEASKQKVVWVSGVLRARLAEGHAREPVASRRGVCGQSRGGTRPKCQAHRGQWEVMLTYPGRVRCVQVDNGWTRGLWFEFRSLARDGVHQSFLFRV